MMKQRVLKEVAKVENGMLVKSYELTEKEYATPSGAVILNTETFERKVSNALDHIYLATLAESQRKAVDKVEKLEKADNVNREDYEKAKNAVSEITAKIAVYPALSVEYDDFAMMVASVITANKMVQLSRAKAMLDALRSDSAISAAEVKKVVVAYVNETIRLNECDYVKPYDASGLNVAKVENLRKVATVETLKWNKKGIISKSESDVKVWSQVMLTIFRDCFRLEVAGKSKSSGKVLFTA